MMNDAIAAISTGLVPAGIGIVRVSGEDALFVADAVFNSPSGRKLSDAPGNTIHYGHIVYRGETLDEVLVTVLRAPHSYTGEDTAEINCHGGVIAVRKVLEAVIKSGARPAEPGEFTKRAYLNGRIDLSQAEAVMDVISSGSEYALKNAMNQLKGELGKRIGEIRSSLLHELAFIESALDDPEHYTLEGYTKTLYSHIEEQQKKLERLLSSFEEGRFIEEGIRTVILGKPNVGKSSLLNRLTGTEKAIVTDIPGTTRDVLEETITMKGFALRIIDTAGLRDSSDPIERIGVERAREKAAEADLILYIADSSGSLDEEDREIIESAAGKRMIFLINKTDLPDRILSADEVKQRVSCPVLEISAKENTGIEKLKEVIEEMFFRGELDFNDEVYITNARHKNLLDEAHSSLENVKNSIEDRMPEDFISIDIAGAVQSLDGITGGDLSEDLTDEIFSKFCMGK